MSDLIRRSALLAEYDKHHVGAPGGARKLIEAAPTIDAVPVDKIHFTDLYLDGREAIAVFKFGNQGITLRKKCEDFAPVVHGRWCKDCDFWCKEEKTGRAEWGNECAPCEVWSHQEDGYFRYTMPTDFCSYGEKNEEDK